MPDSYNYQSNSGSSAPDPYLLADYQSRYGQALELNNQNYNNILGEYQQNQQNVGQGVGGIASGYGQLSGQVQNTIQGIGASQAQQIRDVYAQQSGQLNQSLISRGLGNSTVAGQMQRGVTLDAQKAQIALANQIAQLTAGYQSQLGSAGLQSRLQGLGLQSQQGNTLTGALAGYRTPYPGQPSLGGVNSSVGQGRQQSGYGGGLGGVGSNGRAPSTGILGAFNQGPSTPYAPAPIVQGGPLPGMGIRMPTPAPQQSAYFGQGPDQTQYDDAANYSSGGYGDPGYSLPTDEGLGNADYGGGGQQGYDYGDASQNIDFGDYGGDY